MVYSVAFGYAVIANLIGTSSYNIYPIKYLIGAAFAVGIAMVVGSVVFFMAEPKVTPRVDPIPKKAVNPFHTLIKRAIAAPA
jgi:hypothetical protein